MLIREICVYKIHRLKNNSKFLFYSIFTLYKVIHKSLRDFRPLRYSSRDGHDGGGGMSTEGETLQVSVVLCDAWSETSVAPSQLTQFWQIARHRTLSYPLSTPCFVTIAP
jgi:hypothetical protein